jgi:hypothetical protein
MFVETFLLILYILSPFIVGVLTLFYAILFYIAYSTCLDEELYHSVDFFIEMLEASTFLAMAHNINHLRMACSYEQVNAAYGRFKNSSFKSPGIINDKAVVVPDHFGEFLINKKCILVKRHYNIFRIFFDFISEIFPRFFKVAGIKIRNFCINAKYYHEETYICFYSEIKEHFIEKRIPVLDALYEKITENENRTTHHYRSNSYNIRQFRKHFSSPPYR